MPLLVIAGLQVISVEEQDDERLPRAVRPLDRSRELLASGTSRVGAGEVVLHRAGQQLASAGPVLRGPPAIPLRGTPLARSCQPVGFDRVEDVGFVLLVGVRVAR